jgi:Uma2 family endonuclease
LERYPVNETTAFSVVPQDWLCEVLSPSTKRLDRFQKLVIYAEYGVKHCKHCWYVDPIEKTLEAFILSEGAD